MRETLEALSLLEFQEPAAELAQEYIKYEAAPASYPQDAYHIAAAVFYEMDYLVSWNFRHIVRRKTKDIVRMVNTLRDLTQIEIVTPGELL